MKENNLTELYKEHMSHCKVRRLIQYKLNTYNSNYFLLEQLFGSDLIMRKVNISTVRTYIDFISNHYSDKVTTINSRLKYVKALFYFAIELGYYQDFNNLLKNVIMKIKRH